MIFRGLMGLILVMPAPAVQLEASYAVQLRGDAPSVSPDQAEAMTPQKLGDLLLGREHPPALEARIGPEGMEAPPAPGRPISTRVKLYLEPRPSAMKGFCERTVATIYLEAVDRLSDGSIPASRPKTLSTEQAYQWVGAERSASRCKQSKNRYFIPRPGDDQRALEVVSLLASSSEAASQGKRPPFPVSLEDRMGPEMLAFQRTHPKVLPPNTKIEIITDEKRALASLPLDEISFVGAASTAYPNIVQSVDPQQAITVFLGGVWVVGLELKRGRLNQMRLLRQIPAPS